MSVISNVHNVIGYTGKEKALAGQRLSKVTYKTDKESGVKKDSKCVSIPLVTGASDVIPNIDLLIPAICDYLQTVQDKIVRERIEAGSSVVTGEDIGMLAVVEWLENQGNDGSGRLTKEVVGSWFSENVADELAMVLAEKMGVSAVPTDAESAQILRVVDTFKEKVSALAGGKTSYPAALAVSLKKCVEMAPAGDSLRGKFVARLDKMIAIKEVDLLNLL